MGKYLINELKQYSDEINDLFLDYGDDGEIYDDDNGEITTKDGTSIQDIYDYIREVADDNFIYYSTADEYLGDYDIWDEIKGFVAEFGITPKNQCVLASYVYNREILSELTRATLHTDEYEEDEEK